MNNVMFLKVSFYRNLKNYKFVPKLTEDKRVEIVDKIDTALDKELLKLDQNTLDANMRDYLSTFNLLAGGNNTMFLSKDNVAINLFAGEHMTITASNVGFDKSVYNRAKNIADLLSNKVEMAYSDTYGYLMSDLNKVGSGIEVQCEMNLHAIILLGKINQVRQNVRNLGFDLREKQGDTYIVSTMCNLGRKESELISDFTGIVEKLQDIETESAKILAVENRDEILNSVLRSEAILKSAHLINYTELNNLLTNLRLGANLGYTSVSEQQFNELQKLIKNKNTDNADKNELITLAEQVKKILKGGE